MNDKESNGEHTNVIVYDSNPFTATWTGLQRLIKTNAQTVVGVTFFNILLAVVLTLTCVVSFFAVITFALNHDSAFRHAYSLPVGSEFDFLTSMNDISIYLTWIIGAAVGIFVLALTQSLQLNLAVASARSESIQFGALLKRGIKSTLPILGFIGLVLLALIVSVIVIALLALVLGYAAAILALFAIVAAIYAGLRISFTTYSIIDLHLGPIDALKHSWNITKDHVLETVGSGTVGSLMIAVPGLVLEALSRVTESLPLLSGLFGLLNIALTIAFIIAATMSLAERYVQLHAVAEKKLTAGPLSPFNYLAIVLLLIVAPVLSALSPQLNNRQTSPFNVDGDPSNTQRLRTNLN